MIQVSSRETTLYSYNKILVSNKRDETCPVASPQWSTHVYGVAGFLCGLHSLFMQQAIYWFNSAKWEEKKKREKAAKVQEDSPSRADRDIPLIRVGITVLTEELVTMKEAHSKVTREVTALQRFILSED
jgi:hypothetical protein